MRVDILTLFPKMFENMLGESILRIAQKKKKISIRVHDLRSWATDRHRTVDDKPYGGGAGMVIMVGPVYKALIGLLGKNELKKVENKPTPASLRIVLLTPKGRKFNQKAAKTLSKAKRVILICGHYEGFDERIRNFVTDEISIGDYILTGGEIPAMAVLDAAARLLPGVLGDSASLHLESFEDNLLEYPQYTRPRSFDGMNVPEVLLNGDHGAIDKWRKIKAIKLTKARRKDMMA